MQTKANVVVNNNSIGFCGLLTIVFIVLQLTGVINWSWLWVLAPIWIPFMFWLGLLLFFGIIMVIANYFQ